jgi:hypothetical protein
LLGEHLEGVASVSAGRLAEPRKRLVHHRRIEQRLELLDRHRLDRVGRECRKLGVGLVDGDLLDSEYQAYVDAGVWPDGPPEDVKAYDTDVAKSVYGDDGKVIWPAD